MSRKRTLVVAPGRGSYTKDTLGYLQKKGKVISEHLEAMDGERKAADLPTLTELDSAELFKTQLHTKGEHASALIYACALADFHSIDREKIEIAAVTGNSMGWYIALVLAGVLEPLDGYRLIQTMGSMMTSGLIGGQIIYPVVDDEWKADPQKIKGLKKVIDEVNQKSEMEVHLSIELGGYVVLGASKKALPELLKVLPKDGDFPFQLINHGAFHTPLMKSVSEKAFKVLSPEMFRSPRIPLIDGQGKIWQPWSSDPMEIYRYTLGHQVVEPYHFTRSVSVGLKEFAMENIHLLGPGNSLGGSIGQILVQLGWNNIESKNDFSKVQKSEDAILVSMGM